MIIIDIKSNANKMIKNLMKKLKFQMTFDTNPVFFLVIWSKKQLIHQMINYNLYNINKNHLY